MFGLLALIATLGGCSTFDELLPKGETEAWKEVDGGLPPYPRDAALVAMNPDEAGGANRVFIDLESLSLAKDAVMRYAVVLRSPTGAENAIYEGLRCGTKQAKAYAYGYRGRFEAFPDPRWERITGSGPYAYRNALLDRYLCDANGIVRPVREAAARLRHGFFTTPSQSAN